MKWQKLLQKLLIGTENLPLILRSLMEQKKKGIRKVYRKNFNWSPQISLENGITSTVEWYKNNILKI